MAETRQRNFAIALTAVTTAVVTANVWINSRRKRIEAHKSPVTRFAPLPEEVNWIDQESFEVVTAICDAFVPTIADSELCGPRLREALLGIHPCLHTVVPATDDKFAHDHKSYLNRGAQELGIAATAAKALGLLISPAEQLELSLMLKILSTSVGCYCTAGYLVPFQKLPLHYRVKALEGWRDSPLAKLRVFYQTMKRLTNNLYFSYMEHGMDNPNWSELGYNPRETVGKPRKVTTATQAFSGTDRVDRYLRRKVHYQSVLAELQGTGNSSSGTGNSFDASGTDTLEVDVVVVGSGAGGGMVAAELAKAGLNVLVLEKGGHFRPEEFKAWRESEAFLHTFEKGGLCSTADGNLLVLAGSCVGGGSTINWSASFRTPDLIREDWVDLGLTQFGKDGPFEQSLNAVHGLIHVNSDQSHRQRHEPAEDGAFAVNGNNRMLWEGAEKLGFAPEKIPRNVKGCVDCGHCCHGCPYEAKQSTQTALLEPLLLAGSGLGDGCGAGATSGTAPGSGYRLQVIPHCAVSRVLYAKDAAECVPGADGKAHSCYKRAVGVEASVRVFPDNFPEMSVSDRLHYIAYGERVMRTLFVKAKIVVSAAGAIHTPALLLRSQLTHRGMVGANLTLHPVLGVGGVFPGQETEMASGVSMGVVVRTPALTSATTFATLHSHSTPSSASASDTVDARHRIALETPPAHVGLIGLLFPWTNGTGYPETFSGQGGGLGLKLGMLCWRNSATFIALPRDRSQPSNRVTIDGRGNPVMHYTVTAEDTRLALVGLEMNMRIMRAAGAKFLYLAHEAFPWYNAQPDSATDDEAARFEAFVQSVHREGLHTARMQIFSAHQMSSCRMAASPDRGPVSPSGELYECAALFVADASVLPTSLGINPMVTIEATAHMIAQNIVRKIGQKHPALEAEMRDFRASRAGCSSAACW